MNGYFVLPEVNTFFALQEKSLGNWAKKLDKAIKPSKRFHRIKAGKMIPVKKK